MNTKPKLYIIPGLGESSIGKNYRQIIKNAKVCGFEIVPVKMNWSKDMIMDDFILQADNQIPKDSKNDYVLGFSIGAYILNILAKKKKIKGLIFCDISPYFKENLKILEPENKKYFGEKMWEKLKKYSFTKNVSTSAWFFLGEDKGSVYNKIMKNFPKMWKGKNKSIMVKEAGHNIGHDNYVEAVSKLIKSFPVKNETHL
jgi:hypothetical protein